MSLFVQPIRLRTIILLGLASLGAAVAWSGGCSRPRPRAMVIQPTAARLKPSGAGDSAALFRLARDVELSRQQETLLRLLESTQVNASTRSEVEKELWRLTRIEAAEHEAETALAMQGWPAASVSVLGQEASVAVYGCTLTEDEAASIGRLVADATGLAEASVWIQERP